MFHPLQPELGRGSRENLAVQWDLLLGILAQGQGGKQVSPVPGIPSLGLLCLLCPSFAALPGCSLCFTCVFPGSRLSESGRCDLGSGQLHQPRAPGRFPQVSSFSWYFLQELMSYWHREGGRNQFGRSWRSYSPVQNQASPKMQPELSSLPSSALA